MLARRSVLTGQSPVTTRAEARVRIIHNQTWLLGRRTLIRQIFDVYLFTARAARRVHSRLVQFLFSGTWWKVVGMPIFEMSMDRTLGVIGRILDTFDNACFEGLIVL